MKTVRRLLVVTGDYEVTQRIRAVLGAEGIAVQAAYSHLDALYMLRQSSYDSVFVDAAMTDRRSGEMTTAFIAQQENSPPIIAYLSKEASNVSGDLGTEIFITSLDDKSIRRAVFQAMKIPDVAERDVTKELYSEEPAPLDVSAAWQMEEIQALIDLGRSLTEVLDLSEVLNRVVEAARYLSNAEEGMILLPDGEAGDLYLRAKVGIESEAARNFRVKTKDTLAGHVFNTGEAALIGERGPQKVKTEYFVNSLLYVPILLKGMPIGVLGVNNRNKHDVFNRRHQELLLNLASYAAIAIENARIHGESIKRARELKALVDASEHINASLSLNRTLPSICEQMVRVLNVNHAEIFEWNRDKNELRALARYRMMIWRSGHEPVINLAERSMLRRAFDEKLHLLITAETAADNSKETERLRCAGASAMLVLPIVGGEQVLGLLMAYFIYPLSKSLSPDILQRVQRQALEITMNLAENRISTSASVQRLGQEVNRALKSDWADIAVVTKDGQSLTLLLSVGGGLWLHNPHPTLNMSQYPDVTQSIESQTPINEHLDSDTLQSGAKYLLDETGGRSILGVPLVMRGQPEGLVLFVDAGHNQSYSTREIDLGRAIVGQAATAMENARLVHDLEASLRELKDTQARLIQAARLSAMGELAAAVAHQINNPLTTIVLDAELLLLNEIENSDAHQSLSAILRAGKRAAGVVRRLLATVRPNTSNDPPEAVNLTATIEDTLGLVRAHIERESIKLYAQVPESILPPVWAVPGELDDVWLNLLLNAHDALAGRVNAEMGINVQYMPNDDYIEVVVWDNGPGIPDHLVHEIFKPFFTTKPVGEGTGLGLHICRQIIDRVGGSIVVQSVPEEGTQFFVRLPAMKRGSA
jgi:signal transduction histidine kinase/CheY-like chemotaxis protein